MNRGLANGLLIMGTENCCLQEQTLKIKPELHPSASFPQHYTIS
jgi:hypothetical protein